MAPVAPIVVLLACVFAATLTRSLLVVAGLASRACSRCGRPFERHALGEPVCRCH